MSDFKQKYLKYKKKYLDLKEQIGGAEETLLDYDLECAVMKHDGSFEDLTINLKATREKNFFGMTSNRKLIIKVEGNELPLVSPYIEQLFNKGPIGYYYKFHIEGDKTFSKYNRDMVYRRHKRNLEGTVKDHYFNEEKIPTDMISFDIIFLKLQKFGFKK